MTAICVSDIPQAASRRRWPEATDHLGFLDGLRGLAALFIVCHHSYALVELTGGSMPRNAQFLRYGHFIVSLFIMLSGYCLAMPLFSHGGLRGGWQGFLKRRARRILPPYYAAVGVSLIISLLAGSKIIPMTGYIAVTWQGLLSHLLLVNNVWGNASHTVFGDPTLSGVFWSTAVEWQISLVFPLLVWLWKRASPAVVVSLVGGIAYGIQHFCAGTVWVGLSAPYYLLFALGMLAATVVYSPRFAEWRPKLPWSTLCAASFAGFCWISVTLGFSALIGMMDKADLMFAPFGFLLLVAASRMGKLNRALSWKPLTLLGGFSYSLYLIHEPVLKVLFGSFVERRVDGLGGAAALWITLIAAGPLVVAACRVFYHFFEAPLLRKPSKAASAEPAAAGLRQ